MHHLPSLKPSMQACKFNLLVINPADASYGANCGAEEESPVQASVRELSPGRNSDMEDLQDAGPDTVEAVRFPIQNKV